MYVSFMIPGDTLGSFVYVPCEVMKQRMQVQGTQKSWASAAAKGSISQTHGTQMYGYYNGMLHAGCSIWRDHGFKGLVGTRLLLSIDSAFHIFFVLDDLNSRQKK